MKPWKSRTPRPPRPVPLRFNGATAMKPWKSQELLEQAGRECKLQWGHGDEAVEELGIGITQAIAEHASMGPRR